MKSEREGRSHGEDPDQQDQTEQEIASETRFRLVVEAAPNAMVMINLAGEIVMVNAQAERVFGYSRAELLGQLVEMLVPERFRSHHPAMRATFFTGPRSRPMGAGRDLYGLKRDGSEFPVEIEDVTVVGDKIQIQQVLLNLLRNAAEAIADQECRDIALLTELPRDDTVQISVVDNGPGLPDEVKAKLFQPFISTKKTGMGVGLSICHTIIAAHNGRLWAEPNPEGGTIFSFTLPTAPAGKQADT